MQTTTYIDSIYCNQREQSLHRPDNWFPILIEPERIKVTKFSWVAFRPIMQELSFASAHLPTPHLPEHQYQSLVPLGVRTFECDNVSYWNNCAKVALLVLNALLQERQERLARMSEINVDESVKHIRPEKLDKEIEDIKSQFKFYRACAKRRFGLLRIEDMPREVTKLFDVLQYIKEWYEQEPADVKVSWNQIHEAGFVEAIKSFDSMCPTLNVRPLAGKVDSDMFNYQHCVAVIQSLLCENCVRWSGNEWLIEQSIVDNYKVAFKRLFPRRSYIPNPYSKRHHNANAA